MNLINRIKDVIDSRELSSSAFADQLGVQRSSISHILSGRNKPSLDFVLKLLKAFPDVSAAWLLLGDENQKAPTPLEPSLFAPPTEIEPSIENEVTPETPPVSTPKDAPAHDDDIVERVVVFYANGTCRIYSNKK